METFFIWKWQENSKARSITLGNHSATMCQIGHADVEVCYGSATMRNRQPYLHLDADDTETNKKIIFLI